eukprot:4812508-Prymnesium_polylepis.1
MLKDHMGSSGDHFGTSSVTSTSPPRAARWLMVTTHGTFSDFTPSKLFTICSFFKLFSKFNPPVEIALHQICPMAPLPQLASQTLHRASTCVENVPSPQHHATPPRAAVAAPGRVWNASLGAPPPGVSR